jgi:hypothetical protein
MKYDHIGIPTKEEKEGANYIESIKAYITPSSENKYGIEWVRILDDSPMPAILKTLPHVGFRVDDIEEAVKDVVAENIIVPICSPAEGMRIAFIMDNGAPIEFLEY